MKGLNAAQGKTVSGTGVPGIPLTVCPMDDASGPPMRLF